MNIIEETFNMEKKSLPSISEIQKILSPKSHSFFNLDRRQIREEYKKYSFFILHEEFIFSIKKLMDDFHINKIVELSCGPGWFTYWLRKYGILVEKCVDNFTWKESFKNKSYLSFVEKGDSIEAAKVDNVEMFILSWPYMDSVAANIWKEMKRGKYLLYIGEEKGGCTADDEFFNLIENKEIQRGFPFLSFPNIHDRPILFQK